MYDYGKCHICGNKMEARRINQDFWIKKKLVVVENVPAGVCPQCGEKVVKADVGRKLGELVADSKRLRKAKTMAVPVIRFAADVA